MARQTDPTGFGLSRARPSNSSHAWLTIRRCGIDPRHPRPLDHEWYSVRTPKTPPIHNLLLIESGQPRWKLIEFSGVGKAPRGETMVGFERNIRENGCEMTTEELVEFSARLDDIYDLELIGYFGETEVARITAFDSSEWSVWVNDSVVRVDTQAMPNPG